MKIANFNISDKNPPFIIAEMSCNHGGKLSIAKEIIKQAALAGASAIKLQTFQPKEMTLDVDNKSFRINDPNSLWYKRKLFDLYKEAHTPWQWHEELFKYSKDLKADVLVKPHLLRLSKNNPPIPRGSSL